jgi:hypothetical protein
MPFVILAVVVTAMSGIVSYCVTRLCIRREVENHVNMEYYTKVYQQMAEFDEAVGYHLSADIRQKENIKKT